MKALLVVAAGKATRFGGFPKAFTYIGGRMNIENTISLASSQYDHIYIAVNMETYQAYDSKFQKRYRNCELFGIVTGNGEAHSLLKALRYIHRAAHDLSRVTVCWGDAFFLDDTVFKDTTEYYSQSSRDVPVTVFCALDAMPYAWFDMETSKIKAVHFAGEDGYIREGVHDQSIFLFDIEQGIEYLDRYKSILGIEDEYVNGKEMKLLRSFEYLYQSNEYQAAEGIMIRSGKVLAFNTREEVDRIDRMIAKRSDERVGIC